MSSSSLTNEKPPAELQSPPIENVLATVLELSRNTVLNMRSVYGRSAKVVRWFLDADDNPDSHQNLIISFGPFTVFLEIYMQIYSVVFALGQQIKKQKLCENI